MMTSSNNVSMEERLQFLSNLDDQTFPIMIPTVIYVGVLMFLGIIGNILVLIVYLKKFKPSPTRVFVLSLAVFDLMACVISLPGEVLDLRYTHTFDYIHLCRILRFNNTFSVVSSGVTLIVVSIDRYRKICRPLRRQISIRMARFMVVVAVFVALLLAIPAIIINGRSSVKTARGDIYGVDCSFDDRWKGTLFPLIYNSILFLVFIGSLIVLIVMYILIGRTVFIHRRFKFHPIPNNKNPSPQYSTSETELSSGTGKDKFGKKSSTNNNKEKRISWVSTRKSVPVMEIFSQKLNPGTEERSRSFTNKSGDTPRKPRGAEIPVSPKTTKSITLIRFSTIGAKRNTSSFKHEDRMISKPSKTTLMLFVITMVFIVSFLPHLSLMIIRGIKSDFLDSLNSTGEIIYNVFLRSYFINSAANCIVYSFCNIKFRRELRNLLCPCFRVSK